MIDLNNIFGYDCKLKTLLTIYANAGKENRKQILLSLSNYSKEDLNELIKQTNFKKLNVTHFSNLISSNIFEDINNLEDILDIVEDESTKFYILKKCNSYTFNYLTDFELERIYTITNTIYMVEDPTKYFNYAKDLKIDYCFKYSKINTVIRESFIKSKAGKEILKMRLEEGLIKPEILNIAKSYSLCKDKSVFDFIIDILKEKNLYKQFSKNLVQIQL